MRKDFIQPESNYVKTMQLTFNFIQNKKIPRMLHRDMKEPKRKIKFMLHQTQMLLYA